ncbi:TetR family transcriptional regulator [Streptomyces albus subsp. albus]|nr:TetR family transcriptional regulator [Streptomyces albus subsp. albus]
MLDAAVRTFARRGYRAASMDEIAELAGVSKPLVYLYLNSKEELFTACIRREARTLVAAIRSAVEPEAPADRQLWSGLYGFFSHTAAHPDGWAVLHVQARTQGEPFALEAAAMRAEIVKLVTRQIEAAAQETGCASGPDARETAALAQALVGAAESLADWAAAGTGDADAGTGSGGRESRSAKEAAATLMNLVWAGLENLIRGESWSPGRQESGAVGR